MKIWNSFGSEHSANLVMIGRFKDAASAEKAKVIIDEITGFMSQTDDTYRNADRYPEGLLALLNRLEFHVVYPAELEQFTYGIRGEVKDDKLLIKTDEYDVSAFLKVMIENGARVEVYSGHDYPDEGEESGPEG
jgi:hypothetical protein